MTENPYDAMVVAEAKNQGVDPALALSIMHQESGGNPNATSNQDARGLMQLLPATAKGLGVTDIYDPAQNVKAGVTYIKQGLDAGGGNYALAAAHYFGGPDQKQWGPKTHQYVDDIAARYNKMAADSPATPLPVATLVDAKPPVSAAVDFLNKEADRISQPPAQREDSASYKFLMGEADRVSPKEPQINPVSGEPMGKVSKPLFGANSYASGMMNAGVEGARAGWGTAPIGDTQFFPTNLFDGPLPGMNSLNQGIMTGLNYTAGPALSLGNKVLGAATQGVGDALAVIHPDLAAMATQPFAGGALAMALASQSARAAEARPIADPIPNATQTPMGLRNQPVFNEAARDAMSGTRSEAPAVGPATGPALPPRAELPFPIRDTGGASSPLPPPAGLTATPPPANNLTAPPVGPVRGNDLASPPPLGSARMPEPIAANDGSLSAAATPQELAAMTPRELAAHEARDNLQKLGIDARNTTPNDYELPGVTLSKIELANDSSLAAKSRAVYGHADFTEYRALVDATNAANNEARKAIFNNIAGDPVHINNLLLDAEENINAATTDSFKNKTVADASPVVDIIQSILSGPEGKRAAVQSKITNVLQSLYDPKGFLETDPAMLWGVRKHINDMLLKAMIVVDPQNSIAAHALGQVKDALDLAIEPAAPGFGDALAGYAEAMKPINAMEYLQGKIPMLMNNGILSPAKFRLMMREITKLRDMSGANGAKAISADDLAMLWKIDANLQKSTLPNTLGVGAGSETAGKLSMSSKLMGIGGKVAESAAHAAVGHLVPGFGNLLVRSISGAIGEKNIAARAARAKAATLNELLGTAPTP